MHVSLFKRGNRSEENGCRGSEGPQEATFTFLNLDEQCEAQRGEGVGLRSHSRKVWPLQPYFSEPGGRAPGPRGECCASPHPLCWPGLKEAQAQAHAYAQHTQNRDWKGGRGQGAGTRQRTRGSTGSIVAPRGRGWSRGWARTGQPRPGRRLGCLQEIRGLGRGRAPGALGAGRRWAGRGRGQAGCGRAWSRWGADQLRGC